MIYVTFPFFHARQFLETNTAVHNAQGLETIHTQYLKFSSRCNKLCNKGTRTKVTMNTHKNECEIFNLPQHVHRLIKVNVQLYIIKQVL
jgi:hypothetical protein